MGVPNLIKKKKNAYAYTRHKEYVRLIQISLLNKHYNEIKYFIDEWINLNSSNFC